MLTENKSVDEYKSITLKTCCAVVILLSISFLFGGYVLVFFGIKMPAFELVGGVFLLYVAFTMLVAASESTIIDKLKASIRQIEIVGGVIMIIVGLYLMWFYLSTSVF